MSVLHNVARGAQDGTCPTRWQSCPGRLPKPPENAKIAFRGGWHRLETPQPLRRRTQTPQAFPARASSRGLPRVLGGYHPSRIPTRTIRDRLQIGTKTAPTKPEWMSGSRIARRGDQAGVGLPTTGYCSRRSGGGLQNAGIAFLGDWYKLETPWPLDRPSQTHLGASARAPADCRTWGFGKGVVSSDFPVEVGHCARRALP